METRIAAAPSDTAGTEAPEEKLKEQTDQRPGIPTTTTKTTSFTCSPSTALTDVFKAAEPRCTAALAQTRTLKYNSQL